MQICYVSIKMKLGGVTFSILQWCNAQNSLDQTILHDDTETDEKPYSFGGGAVNLLQHKEWKAIQIDYSARVRSTHMLQQVRKDYRTATGAISSYWAGLVGRGWRGYYNLNSTPI